ncbi:MAG: methyltransferase [Edaphobacter sp.]|uniref:methyltransferase n=1 Tax=Edaphobacter sp. TaxID=1934404 RepID=UPI00239A0ECD|nr:methyltransferase [Edaphobacter sp.]MDE1175863.1 methyltransferase [Edaphobacter sp.]
MSATTATPPRTNVSPERILQFAWGYAPTLAIEAAIHHRVFDVLNDTPRTLAETAAATGASERGLRAIMNLLTGLGLLAREGTRYALTPESAAFLVSTKPGFQGGFFKHTSQQLLPKWLKLNEIVATGHPARSVNTEGDGSAFFQRFVHDIFPLSYPAATTLAKHLALGDRQGSIRALDLAAGSGVWGIALAEQAPNVTVTAFDWEGVLPATVNMVERFGLSPRFEFIAGDLNITPFGGDYDVVTLGHILHSEGAAQSRELLKKTFAALNPGGTVAIAEFLVNQDRTGPPGSLIFAANMLVNTDDGDTFSFEEISQWLTAAGFTKPRTLEAPGPSPLILATKV